MKGGRIVGLRGGCGVRFGLNFSCTCLGKNPRLIWPLDHCKSILPTSHRFQVYKRCWGELGVNNRIPEFTPGSKALGILSSFVCLLYYILLLCIFLLFFPPKTVALHHNVYIFPCCSMVSKCIYCTFSSSSWITQHSYWLLGAILSHSALALLLGAPELTWTLPALV